MGVALNPLALAALVLALLAAAALIPLGLALMRTRRALAHAEAEARQAQQRQADEVAERSKAEQRLLRHERDLRAMFDGFPGFLAVTDAELRYDYVNDHAVRWIGKPREEVIGHSIRENLSETRVGEIIEFMSTAQTGVPMTVESHYAATPTREATWLQVTQVMGAPDAAGRRSCHVFAIDVTRRKLAEAGAIAARDEAERANRAKSAFLASMSHELRTPLNAILGFGQLLAADAGPAAQAIHRAHASEIIRASRHLLVLINDVLDLAMVERGKLNVSLEPVAVHEMIEECVGLLQPLARKDGILLTAGTTARAVHVRADRTRLRQVILNLGANAIKYNRAAGTVRIIGVESGGQVRIDVIDSGQGLTEQQQARLFQAFERLDADSTAIEGAGLGLALSRAFMHAMQGRISVSSTPGRGSTFSLSLPAAAPAAGVAERFATQPPAAPPEASPAALPGKVLYIEDNRINTVIMECMVERMAAEAGPIELLTAPTALIGLEMAAEEQPDLILLDLHLPEMDGFEVLRRLRAHEDCSGIPVIAFSANSMPAHIERAMAAGFDHYLSKPVDMHELKATLQQFGARTARAPGRTAQGLAPH